MKIEKHQINLVGLMYLTSSIFDSFLIALPVLKLLGLDMVGTIISYSIIDVLFVIVVVSCILLSFCLVLVLLWQSVSRNWKYVVLQPAILSLVPVVIVILLRPSDSMRPFIFVAIDFFLLLLGLGVIQFLKRKKKNDLTSTST